LFVFRIFFYLLRKMTYRSAAFPTRFLLVFQVRGMGIGVG
jgi:hypothetical protein